MPFFEKSATDVFQNQRLHTHLLLAHERNDTADYAVRKRIKRQFVRKRIIPSKTRIFLQKIPT